MGTKLCCFWEGSKSKCRDVNRLIMWDWEGYVACMHTIAYTSPMPRRSGRCRCVVILAHRAYYNLVYHSLCLRGKDFVRQDERTTHLRSQSMTRVSPIDTSVCLVSGLCGIVVWQLVLRSHFYYQKTPLDLSRRMSNTHTHLSAAS